MSQNRSRPRTGRLVASIVLVALIGYVGTLIVANRQLAPEASVMTPAARSQLPSSLAQTITLTTWNLGYAGLGEESDFVADGGHSLFPPSGAVVQKNLDGIVATLGKLDQDVLLLQEVSKNSPLSWWKPVFATVAASYADRQVFYRPDVATWGIPWPLAIDHGTVVAAKANPADVEVLPIPAEPTLMMGFLKRRYALQIVRIPIAGSTSQWVIANLHLSAFDDGGKTRRAQLEAVLAFAQGEYARGNHVILGGDWNMVLHDPQRPSTTSKQYLFWVVDFPHGILPPDWTITTDMNSPTVRTLYKSYVAGENFVTTIDGFITSPNVQPGPAKAYDTGFAFSDHMPVTASFEAK